MPPTRHGVPSRPTRVPHIETGTPSPQYYHRLPWTRNSAQLWEADHTQPTVVRLYPLRTSNSIHGVITTTGAGAGAASVVYYFLYFIFIFICIM